VFGPGDGKETGRAPYRTGKKESRHGDIESAEGGGKGGNRKGLTAASETIYSPSTK